MIGFPLWDYVRVSNQLRSTGLFREVAAERDEVGRGGIGRGEHWQSQNSGIVTVTRPRQTGTQMSLGCCLDTSSYHSLLLDLLNSVLQPKYIPLNDVLRYLGSSAHRIIGTCLLEALPWVYGKYLLWLHTGVPSLWRFVLSCPHRPSSNDGGS